MVRAGSLKYGNTLNLMKRFAAAIIAVAVVLGIGIVAYNALNGEDGERVVAATSTTVPKSISDEVLKKQYPVSQPAAIPTNFVRTKVEIISPTSSKSGCEEILQNFQGSEDPNEAFIDIYSYASGCAFLRPDDAENFTVGDYSGWVSDPDSTVDTSDDDLTLLLEITVNGGPVRLETDLTRSQISKVLEKFVSYSDTPPSDSLKIIVS